MADIILNRTRQYKDKQVIGSLTTDTFSCVSLELPWKDNKHNVSCIPKGTYQWERLESSPSFDYPHLWIKDVPNRSYIKIHAGNYVDNTLGCVLVGDDLVDINNDGLVDVTNSRDTLKELLTNIEQSGTIEIIDEIHVM